MPILSRSRVLFCAAAVVAVTSQASAVETPGAAKLPPVQATRTQIGVVARAHRQLQTGAPESISYLRRQPALNRFSAFLKGTLDPRARRDVAELIATSQARYGKLTTLPEGKIPSGFVAQKALALAAYGRAPDLMTDEFVRVAGRVEGEKITSRNVFVQHWSPVAEGEDGTLTRADNPSKKIFVLAPGYQETGRNYYGQIDKLTRQGYDVFVLDLQWAGFTTDEQGVAHKGQVDRGFGIALGVAGVAGHVAAWAHAKYGDDAEVILVGHSMGGGPGVIAALALNDSGGISGGIELEGPAMPKGLSAIVQAPYFGATPSLMNKSLIKLGSTPLGDIALPPVGLPPFARDKTAQALFADRASLNLVKSRANAFEAPMADITHVLPLVTSIRGRVYVVQETKDMLASTAATNKALAPLGGRVKFGEPAGTDHDIIETPGIEDAFLEGIDWVSGHVSSARR